MSSLEAAVVAAAVVEVTHDSAAAIHALKPPEAERRRICTPKARRCCPRPDSGTPEATADTVITVIQDRHREWVEWEGESEEIGGVGESG
uniref:Uncharacterized protein n=1 Tax=Oryza barthii TaxID=65489 RepID=A0A0D3HMJ4_9ORYZ